MTETVTRGGFVITTKTNNILGGPLKVNKAVLEAVVKALNIPHRDRNVDISKAIDQVVSIYIYRDHET